MAVSGTQQVTYESLDACVEALARRGMDLELLQLGPGSGRVSMQTTFCEKLTLQRVHIDAPAIRRGSLNPDTVSFALWAENRPREGTWCGQPIGTAGISVFPDDFAATGRHHLSGTVIEVEPGHCSATAALLELDLKAGWRRGTPIYPLPRSNLSSISRSLSSLETGVGGENTELSVLAGIVQALSQSQVARPRASQRAKAFSAARDHIRNCGSESPSIPALCRAAGVSLRTLEYAFRERVGMTPVQYLKVYRLNQVRRILRKGEVRSVADAANAWGFWHMGKFAADYRAVYGLNPSGELQR